MIDSVRPALVITTRTVHLLQFEILDMAKTKGVRPITRALNLVRLNMTDAGNGSASMKNDDRIELMNILHDMDASTGKPDKARKTKGKKKRT